MHQLPLKSARNRSISLPSKYPHSVINGNRNNTAAKFIWIKALSQLARRKRDNEIFTSRNAIITHQIYKRAHNIMYEYIACTAGLDQ